MTYSWGPHNCQADWSPGEGLSIIMLGDWHYCWKEDGHDGDHLCSCGNTKAGDRDD